MNNMPHPTSLTPADQAWLLTQMVISNARSAATLRMEMNKVDDWANGVFAAVRDMLYYLLKESPELGEKLAKDWLPVADAFDRTHVYGLPAEPGESLEFLEARKMLCRFYGALDLMPKRVR